MDLVTEVTSRGVTMERVRITALPPATGQRYLHWLGPINAAAGEQFRYLSQAEAWACGLQPELGDEDWWLFDDTPLMTFDFDDAGHWLRSRVTTNPARIERARRLWAIARAASVTEPAWVS